MHPRRLVLIVGTALTTFLVVAAVVTELAVTVIEFSVFLGLPAGLGAAAVALFVAAKRLTRPVSPADLAVAAAIATAGYAVLGGFAVRYAVASSRSLLSPVAIGIGSLVVAVVVGLVVWLRRDGGRRA